MEIQTYQAGCLPEKLFSFWQRNQLFPRQDADFAVEVMEDGNTAAAAARCGNVLKYFAVDAAFRGCNLTAILMTELRKEAFARGIRHLFLYTHPENSELFSPFGFYPVAQSDTVLFMENKRNSARDFAAAMPAPVTQGRIGAIVMHADPFTRGHRYLVEQAASQMDHVYVFVLSEDRGFFSKDIRLQAVKLGCQDLKNVTVLETGPYLISAATFPDYFLKQKTDRTQAQCGLDGAIFLNIFVPRFGITDRFVGTEPMSAVTDAYNAALKTVLTKGGVQVHEVPRLCLPDGRYISATNAREAYLQMDDKTLSELLPETTQQLIR